MAHSSLEVAVQELAFLIACQAVFMAIHMFGLVVFGYVVEYAWEEVEGVYFLYLHGWEVAGTLEYVFITILHPTAVGRHPVFLVEVEVAYSFASTR